MNFARESGQLHRNIQFIFGLLRDGASLFLPRGVVGEIAAKLRKICVGKVDDDERMPASAPP